jgi:hypothetical protein
VRRRCRHATIQEHRLRARGAGRGDAFDAGQWPASSATPSKRNSE